MFTKITSQQNQLVKLAVSLQEKRSREETGLFLLEGETFIKDVLSSGVEAKYIFASQEQLLELFRDSGAELVLVDEAVLKRLATTDSAPTLVMVAKQKAQAELSLKPGLYLYLENIQDPGNLGSMIRTAVAAGVQVIYLSPACADIYNPKTLRASTGALFRATVITSSDIPKSFDQYLATSSTHKACLYTELAFSKNEKILLMLGSEGNGLSDSSIASATKIVEIPMASGVESINVAAATAVLVFALKEQFE